MSLMLRRYALACLLLLLINPTCALLWLGRRFLALEVALCMFITGERRIAWAMISGSSEAEINRAWDEMEARRKREGSA